MKIVEKIKNRPKLKKLLLEYSNRRDELIRRAKFSPPSFIKSFKEYKNWLIEPFINKDYSPYSEEDGNMKIEEMGVELLNGKEIKDQSSRSSNQETSRRDKSAKKGIKKSENNS